MRILMAASEGVPFSKTGGLADVVGALPAAIARLGHEVGVVLPLYRTTRLKISEWKTVIASISVPSGRRLLFPKLCEGPAEKGVRHFFLDYSPFSIARASTAHPTATTRIMPNVLPCSRVPPSRSVNSPSKPI